MREVQFSVPMDMPRSPRDKFVFKTYLRGMVGQVGVFGKNGRRVGLGYIWQTQTALGDGGLLTQTRRMLRAMRNAGLTDMRADIYFLEQRVDYITDGEPNVIVTLKET